MVKRKRLHISLTESDIDILKKEAERLDVKSASLIHAILHHYAMGLELEPEEFIERDPVGAVVKNHLIGLKSIVTASLCIGALSICFECCANPPSMFG